MAASWLKSAAGEAPGQNTSSIVSVSCSPPWAEDVLVVLVELVLEVEDELEVPVEELEVPVVVDLPPDVVTR
jgi:hypothetical protein